MSSSAPQHDDDGVLQTTERLPDQWVSDLFYRALTNFRIQKGVGSSACQKQTQMYVSHLKNNSYWAVKIAINIFIPNRSGLFCKSDKHYTSQYYEEREYRGFYNKICLMITNLTCRLYNTSSNKFKASSGVPYFSIYLPIAMSFNYRSIALLTSITLLLTLLTTRIDVKLYRFINHRISSITFIPTYSPLKEISAVHIFSLFFKHHVDYITCKALRLFVFLRRHIGDFISATFK
ncbi:nose resistant to fluoxetine protein 6-like [Aphis craccivora]|uniref:Nose resistant to fluoxetine protein 6-like n=1 Tax=Aphis craccivora TaxID=307492 RepID=A0A6G0W7Q0_APHCR|nr:nose resistant to fluoxetine protein 6-like [Aphis craccivora]